MFCPVCKYEFRRGFTHCNQCDVDLVDALPVEEPADDQTSGKASAKMVAPVLLWQGLNAGSFNQIRLALDAAGVPYNREDLDARLLYNEPYAPLEIWVPSANLADAQQILDEVLAVPATTDAISTGAVSAQPEHELAEAFSNEEEQDEAADDIRHEDVFRELYPEDATAEVWSGSDETMALALKSCLTEIGIACYIRTPDSEEDTIPDTRTDKSAAPFAVRVLPENESRAVEIVRQITSASPPE